MSGLQFRVAARTDAAGKYNATAPLEGNEDNMFLDADLSNQAQGEFMADEVVNLSDKGCLMVVADGMGGMNAGEVASAIAIKTVMEYFDFEHLKDKTFRDSRSRINYMEEVVVAADTAIKADSRTNKEHEGMGSTIIMAWLCDNEICLTWCGDSRAYLYRPGRGFWQVSKDHSYVQGLVDDGKITMDEAFDHPYGNIITRSLGDPEKKAKPESVNFDVFQGDIFMLCSDGLSGVLRDHKTSVEGQRVDTENLEDIIAANRASMAQCRDELFEAAQRNDWYDNVTAILCEVVKGKALPANEPDPMKPIEEVGYSAAPNPVQSNGLHHSRISIRKKSLPIVIVASVLLLGVVGFLVWLITRDHKPSNDNEYFAYCKEHPTIENYRSYVKKYPQGEFVDLANNWINEWEADSSAKAKQESQSSKNVENNSEKGESNKKENQGEQRKSSNSEDKMPTEDDYRGNDIVDSSNPEQGLIPDNPEQGLTPSNPSQGLTPSNPSQGLNPAGGLKPGKSVPASSEEEAYKKTQREGASIDDYVNYIMAYGKKGEHGEKVLNLFQQAYTAELKKLTTEDQINSFMKKHPQYMIDARIENSRFDNYIREQAKKKLDELRGNRPEPGIQNAPKNNSSKLNP